MKIRNKITILLVFAGIFLILLSNYIFEGFFKSYLEDQEINQFHSISKTIDSFFNEDKIKRLATVNDWSHWDDTYYYLKDQNPTYLEVNVTEDIFENLDINFFLVVNEDGSVKTKFFYDSESGKSVNPPASFSMDKITQMTKGRSDISSIIENGGQYYCVAASSITDSAKARQGNGMLIFGHLIDKKMVDNIEEIINGQISISLTKTMRAATIEKLSSIQYNTKVLMNRANLNFDNDMMLIEYYIPMISDSADLIQLTVSKPRDFYIGGLEQIRNFKLIYSAVMVILIGLIIILLGRYLSPPFVKLIKEVKDIDITKDSLLEVKPDSNNEFSFLRHSINVLLDKIRADQMIVKETKDKLQATLNSVGDAVITVDNIGDITFMNPVAVELTGYQPDEVYGNSFEKYFDIVTEVTRTKVKSPVKKAFESKNNVVMENNTILISKDFRENAIEYTAAPIKNEQEEVMGVVIVFRECNERVEKIHQTEYLSFHDYLTGLYNRRFLEEELKRLDTARNLPLSIVYADVDGLKTINDVFGHQYGDLLLQKVAYVLKSESRADDIISRTGGDEFVLLLPVTVEEDAKQTIQRIQKAISQEKIMEINLSVSFGCATKVQELQSTWGIMEKAEEAMYKNKNRSSDMKRNDIIKSIIRMLFKKSPSEEAHSKRTAMLCEKTAEACMLDDDKIKELGIAGALHDIGKIAVDEAILNKTDKLNEAEIAQIRNHPETGYRILVASSEHYEIAEYVRSNHERWDGKGYPGLLAGKEIPIESRIIAIASAYDAMTSDTTYGEKKSELDAVNEMNRCAGTQFDPELLKIFIEKVLRIK